MSFLAAVLEWSVFLLLLPVLLLHPRVRQGIRRRLGFYEGDIVRRRGPRVWLHGASAGDVLGLVPIVRELKRLRPDARVLISAITDSGASMAEQRLIALGLADAVTYLPYDLPGACRRAIAALHPDVLVLEYTELWPQLIHAAARAGVRLAMTNGRISPGNLTRYRALFAVAGNLLQQFDVLMMRADDEAERALQLGAPRDRLHVTGNTKFDALAVSVPDGQDPALRGALALGGERLWVCGSTHEGEEGPLLDVYAALRRDFPDLRLVLAPRYVERSARVLSLARERALSSRLRSEAGGDESVIVLDTIGELVRVYQLATVVFVGGSFTRRGGARAPQYPSRACRRAGHLHRQPRRGRRRKDARRAGARRRAPAPWQAAGALEPRIRPSPASRRRGVGTDAVQPGGRRAVVAQAPLSAAARPGRASAGAARVAGGGARRRRAPARRRLAAPPARARPRRRRDGRVEPGRQRPPPAARSAARAARGVAPRPPRAVVAHALRPATRTGAPAPAARRSGGKRVRPARRSPRRTTGVPLRRARSAG